MFSRLLRFFVALAVWCAALPVQAASLAEKLPAGFIPDFHNKEIWSTQMAPAYTVLKAQMIRFHDHMLLWIISAIVAFVALVMLYILGRFYHRRGHAPSKTSHNVPLEIIWTLIPIIILTVIAVPSLKMLYSMDRAPGTPDVTIKVTGHQWYWEFEYPDQKFSFNSNIIADKDLKPDEPRLLSADNHLVLPLGAKVQFLVTAADSLHGFFIPELGANRLAVPGRVNEVYVVPNKLGTVYGQCSKICGINHGYMPMTVDIVSQADFEVWLAEAQKKYADNGNGMSESGKLTTAQSILQFPTSKNQVP